MDGIMYCFIENTRYCLFRVVEEAVITLKYMCWERPSPTKAMT